jgi:hypothetical protein
LASAAAAWVRAAALGWGAGWASGRPNGPGERAPRPCGATLANAIIRIATNAAREKKTRFDMDSGEPIAAPAVAREADPVELDGAWVAL